MTFSKARFVRLILGAACLSICDDGSSARESPIAQQHARAGRALMRSSAAGAARRTHRGALLDGTIPLNLGHSAGAATFYGYAPGSYGGLGCYDGVRREFVCP